MIKLKAKIYGWSAYFGAINDVHVQDSNKHTIGGEQTWIALQVSAGKRFNDSINLLRLSRESNVHQQFAKCHVERIVYKVELLDM
jgi:hypothetical protein